MPSNLLIPLDGHASFLEVGTFEYGVLAEFVLDGYHGVLQGFFLALLVLGSFPLRRYSGVIREEVKLLSLVLRLWYAFLADDVVGGDCYPPYQ